MNSDEFVTPNVSYVLDTDTVYFNDFFIDYSKEYFTIENTGSEALTFQLVKNATAQTVSYMESDSSDWVDTSDVITVAPQSEIKLKGAIIPVISYGIGTFKVSGNTTYNVKGNVMSLLYGDEFSDKTDLTGNDYVFYRLFEYNTKLVDSLNLILPATTLTKYCYQGMFRDCTSLVSAPELPATTLVNTCYEYMFGNCASLASAPELPATTLATNCYSYMFHGCTSLASAPELPATTLASNCYDNMFYRCTSLVSAPELPATTLANNCYSYMFDGCTSLASAPELPATTLTSGCYRYMFQGCTSLVSAPELPATTLATYCYSYMFDGCTSLVSAPELLATTLATYCYSGMFQGCSKLNKITMLATDISAAGCLYTWVNNVSSSGTFIKNPSMTSLPNGANGIPNGWTVVDYEG